MCNPVVFAYAVVTLDRVFLFIEEAKVSMELREHLGPGIEVRAG